MFKFSIDIKGLIIEISLRKLKWLFLVIYTQSFLSKHDYFNQVGKGLDFYGVKYKNGIIMLNTIDSEEVLSDFLEERKLSNLVHLPT